MPRLQPGERRPCAACDREMVGARSQANPRNTLPVVMEPSENGNVLVYKAADGVLTGLVIGNAVILGFLREKGVPLRLNHFADCPDSVMFERGGGDG